MVDTSQTAAHGRAQPNPLRWQLDAPLQHRNGLRVAAEL
jgi:hypothetical protein